MSFEVHQAKPEEAEALSKILQSANEFKHSQGDHLWGKYPFTVEDAEKTIDEGFTYIATINGKPAGSIKIQEEDQRIWGDEGTDGQALYAHRVTVNDEFRGQDIGRQMLDWAADHAQETGRSLVRLDCPSDNQELCRYYSSLGFNVVRSLVISEDYKPLLFQKPVTEQFL